MKKIVLVTVLILFLIIISAVLFIQNKNLKNEIGLLNNKITELEKQQTVSPVPTPIAEKPPEGWKEYSDDEYKFKIWYPLRLSYAGIPDNVLINVYPHKYKNYIEYIDKKVDAINFSVTTISDDVPITLMDIYVYPTDIAIKDFIKINKKNLVDGKEIDKYINEIKSYNNLNIYKFEIPGELTKYYTKRNNQIFIFDSIYEYFNSNIISNTHKTVEQMVKSFQFID